MMFLKVLWASQSTDTFQMANQPGHDPSAPYPPVKQVLDTFQYLPALDDTLINGKVQGED